MATPGPRLLINGIEGVSRSIPHVNKRKYKYSAFDGPVLTYRDQNAEKSVDVKRTLEGAWRFITNRAAVHRPCNDYFKTLPRGKTLQEVLLEGDIYLHCLVPKSGYNFGDLPGANAAGRDIGINPLAIIDSTQLASTLIHELAHVAGASTNNDPTDTRSIAAETALRHCLCVQQFDPGNFGLIEDFTFKGYRIA